MAVAVLGGVGHEFGGQPARRRRRAGPCARRRGPGGWRRGLAGARSGRPAVRRAPCQRPLRRPGQHRAPAPVADQPWRPPPVAAAVRGAWPGPAAASPSRACRLAGPVGPHPRQTAEPSRADGRNSVTWRPRSSPATRPPAVGGPTAGHTDRRPPEPGWPVRGPGGTVRTSRRARSRAVGLAWPATSRWPPEPPAADWYPPRPRVCQQPRCLDRLGRPGSPPRSAAGSGRTAPGCWRPR